jgi:hypothetical protein
MGQLLRPFGGDHEGHDLGGRLGLSAHLAKLNERFGARILEILGKLLGFRDPQVANSKAFSGETQ